METRLQMCNHICPFRCRMPCRVRTARADLTDREAVHWGDAKIKSSTRISEASDTLAWALRFSEEGAALLSLSVWAHTVAKEEETKVHIYCNTDTKRRFKDLLPNQVKDRAQPIFSINFLLWVMGTSKNALFSVEVGTVWLFLTGKISVCHFFPRLF